MNVIFKFTVPDVVVYIMHSSMMLKLVCIIKEIYTFFVLTVVPLVASYAVRDEVGLGDLEIWNTGGKFHWDSPKWCEPLTR
jgi:hypothetical protein